MASACRTMDVPLRCCLAQVWHMDRPAEMLVLPLEAELPPNAVVRVNQPGSLVRTQPSPYAVVCLPSHNRARLLWQPSATHTLRHETCPQLQNDRQTQPCTLAVL
jgi:hypothetical protein